jgi:hypothetical protein
MKQHHIETGKLVRVLHVSELPPFSVLVVNWKDRHSMDQKVWAHGFRRRQLGRYSATISIDFPKKVWYHL